MRKGPVISGCSASEVCTCLQSSWQFLGTGLTPVTATVKTSLEDAMSESLGGGTTVTLTNFTSLSSPGQRHTPLVIALCSSLIYVL